MDDQNQNNPVVPNEGGDAPAPDAGNDAAPAPDLGGGDAGAAPAAEEAPSVPNPGTEPPAEQGEEQGDDNNAPVL